VISQSLERGIAPQGRASRRADTLAGVQDVSGRRATQLGFQPPAIDEEELAAVTETLRSGWLTTGPRAAELERRMAEYLEAEHVLAVASGTAALHLSLVALGIGPGDEVITTPITWPATANVIVHTGATPVFVDVRDSDLNIDPDLVAKAVTERTKAIVPVDLAGQPCDLDPILALGLPVIEDAAHAAESAYRGRKIGSIADATCFSLYATKNVAAGEGGLIATNRSDVAEAVQELRLMRRGDGSLYDLVVPGYKANLPDVLAAIALVQLDKLERHAAIRRRQFELYDEAVADLDGIEPLARDPRDTHALHLYVVRIDAARAGATRDEYQRALAEERISTSIHFLPVHRLSWYRERFPEQPPLPVADRAGAEVLSLPLSPAHSEEDIGDAIAALRRVHARFAG
jgi:dTDP-4-amino-4,6-dideoxygalactose transaminase